MEWGVSMNDKEKSDIEALVEFLERLEEIFSTVEKKTELFPEKLQPHISEAWKSVREKLIILSSQISKDALPRLEAAGLTGSEMNFKLEGFYSAYNVWFEATHNSQVITLGRYRHLLKTIFQWANLILFNLVAALPGSAGFADAVREFKMAIEAAMNLKEIEK